MNLCPDIYLYAFRKKILSVVLLILSSLGFFYLLLPFRFYTSFITPQSEIIIHTLYISILVSVFHFMYRMKTPFSFKPTDFLILLYAFYLGIHLINSYHSTDKEIWYSYLALFSLYFMLRSLPNLYLHYYFYLFPFAVLIQFYYGIAFQMHYFTPGKNLSQIYGSFLNSGIWCQFIAIVSLFSICGIGFCKFRKYILILLLAFFSVLLWAGNSRTAWIGLVIGIVYLIFHDIKTPWPLLKKTLLILVGIFIVTIILSVPTNPLKNDSLKGRSLIWQISFPMLWEHPVQGSGIDSFRKNYMRFQEDHFRKYPDSPDASLADDNIFAFSEPLRIQTEQGSIGSLFVLLILLSVFYSPKNFPAYPKSYFAAQAGLIAYLTAGLFSYPCSVFQLHILPVLCIARIVSEQKAIPNITVPFKTTVFLIPVFSLLLLYLIPYQSACIRCYKILETNKFSREIELSGLKKIHPLFKNNPLFGSNYGMLLRENGMPESSKEILEETGKFYSSYALTLETGKTYARLGDYNLADSCWLQASHMIPHRFTPLYLRTRLYHNTGRPEQALLLADEILHKPVKIYTPQLYLILNETRKLKEQLLQKP